MSKALQNVNILIFAASLLLGLSDLHAKLKYLPSRSLAILNLGSDTAINSCDDNFDLGRIRIDPSYPGYWFKSSSSPSTIRFSDSLSRTSQVSGLSFGLNVLIWKLKSSSVVDSIVVVINHQRADAGRDSVFITCKNIIELKATNYSNLSGTVQEWQTLFQPSDNSISIVSPKSATTQVINLDKYGEYKFLHTVKTAQCPADSKTIAVSNRQLKAVVPDEVKICGNTGLLNATFIENSVKSFWSNVEKPAGSSVPELTPINNYTTQASKLDKPGNYKFKYKVTNGVCPSDSSILDIVNNKAFASTSVNRFDICKSGILNGNDPSLQGLPGARGFWKISLPSQAGKPLYDSTLFNSEIKNFTKPGSYAFTWTIIKEACESDPATVIVDVNQPYRVGILKNDTTICDRAIELKAWRPDVELQNATGKWDIISAPLGSTADIGLDFNTQLRNINKPGLYTIVWKVTKTTATVTCTNSDTVKIKNNQPTLIDGLGNSRSQICGNETEITPLRANLEINNATGSMEIVGWPNTVSQPLIKAFNSGYKAEKLNKPGQYKFRWVVSAAQCSLTDTFSIYNNQPTQVSAGPDQDFCGDSIKLSPQNAKSEISTARGSWEYISSPLLPDVRPQIDTTLGANLAAVRNLDKPGTYMFKWTVSNKNCFKSDTVTMVSHQPAMIDGLGGADSNFCGPLLSLTPLSPMIEFPNARGRWSGTVRGPSGTQPSLASKSGNTYNFKGFSLPGTYTLEWIVQNTYNTLVCTETQKINVVNNQPTIIGLGESANVCGSSGQISPTIAADFEFPTAIGRWQFIPQANRSPIYDPTSFALDISKLGKAGIYNFVWTVKNLGCSLSDTIKIINDQPSIIDALLANDENDTSYCRSDFIMVANNPKDEDPNFIGQWTKTPGAGEVSNRTSPKALTSLVNGENIYVWQINNQANSLCKTIYDSVTIRKEPANYGIVIENGLTEVHVCKDTITLDLQLNKNFNPDVINWNTKGSSTGAIIINRNAVSPFVINLSYGKNIFEVEVMKGICSDIGFITIVRDSLPSNVAITTPLDGSFICAESILLTAPDPNKQISSAKGEWTVISHNQSHFSNSDLSLPTATLSELQRGNTYSAIWSVSNGMCGPITETVNFTVQEEINLPDQDIDTVLCGKNSFEISLSDQGPGAVLYGWEQSYGNPIVFKDKLSPKTTIQNIKEGQYVFIWKVESESCKDSVILNIISKPIVSKAFAGRDTILCSSLDFPLQPNQPLIGTGRWTRVAGTAPIQPEPASQTIPLSNGKNTFVWKISKDGHCSTVDTIEIINYIPPIPANAGLDITTYADQYTLTASDPSPGKGYLTSLNHSPLLRKLNDEQTEIFNLADGENKFTWTVQNGTCPSTTDTISIIKETFIIPNAFSPNNDLTNDFFEIKGLHQFGQADLIVFNRIGEEVYSNSNYNNSWDGKDKSGNRLDDDTYYFILKIKNKAPIKNFVVLKR